MAEMVLTPRQRRKLERCAWEEKNRHEFEEDFQRTQDAGCERHGMMFVRAQEAALGAAYGGIYPPFDPTEVLERGQVSRMVLAVLDAVRADKRA